MYRRRGLGQVNAEKVTVDVCMCAHIIYVHTYSLLVTAFENCPDTDREINALEFDRLKLGIFFILTILDSFVQNDFVR